MLVVEWAENIGCPMTSSTLADRELDMVAISRDICRYAEKGVLPILLKECTSGANIAWATGSHDEHGEGFHPEDQIEVGEVNGETSSCHARICTRAEKAEGERAALTRTHAEVFTPSWVVAKMVDALDADLREGIEVAGEAVRDGSQLAWQRYVDARWLEITCGEAPYLVNRYDASTGACVPLESRVGVLDRKLVLVTANTESREEWLAWAQRALQATYGYEYQGDNLLIARVNILRSVEDYLEAAGYEALTAAELEQLADIVSWNIWQMDGLTRKVPFKENDEAKSDVYQQPSLFGFSEPEEDTPRQMPLDPTWNWFDARTYDWKENCEVAFNSISAKGKRMKFDYVIGNPPYQEEQEGDNANFAPPIYNKFMDGAYEVSDKVELITPARFLFNAGSTPKAWNKKMLNDPHLKVEYYEADSSKVFPDTDIKGGVAITYRDADKDFGATGTFTAFPELTSIYRKADCKSESCSLASIIFTQTRFNLDRLYSDHPKLKEVIGSGGKDRRFRNNIFDKVSLFADSESDGSIKVLGIQKNKRVWKYIDAVYVDMSHENIEKWKVLVPRANGSGALGEVLSTPLIGAPLIGYTQSFIAIGSFETKQEAAACLKYVKSKFARVLLGILKITQDNDRGVWKYIPLQDFTSSSDIDWTQSVAEIDVQLYKKYGLSKEEIDFIETHVKAME